MNPILISQQTARKFVLGKQGLWPGRRWKGKKETAQAIRALEAVQLDPLNIVARSQDIVMHRRVPESLAEGKVPNGWKPKETTTLEEVTFLSPLDIVSARGRAKKLFDFEYKWEVYTPAHQRRWGYYVLPILYGDDLAARLDLKLDRTTMMLQIKGFWHEDDAPVEDVDFAGTLVRGLIRFANLWGAETGYPSYKTLWPKVCTRTAVAAEKRVGIE